MQTEKTIIRDKKIIKQYFLSDIVKTIDNCDENHLEFDNLEIGVGLDNDLIISITYFYKKNRYIKHFYNHEKALELKMLNPGETNE